MLILKEKSIECLSYYTPQELHEESFYLNDDVFRKVQSKGEINFKNGTFYVRQGYKGELIALRPIGELRWEVYYCWKRLREIDLNKQIKAKVKSKKYYTCLLP